MSLVERAETETIDFHRFLECWFAERTDDPGRLDAVLAKDFHIVSPQGEVTSRAEMIEEVEAAHGVYDDAEFSIRIEAFEPRYVAEEVCLATYEEWRRVDSRSEGRVSTALFREGGTPNGVEWVHVHETGMQV